LGIGLPVRDIIFDHFRKANGIKGQRKLQEKKRQLYEQIDTALETSDGSGFRRPLSYQELRELGAPANDNRRKSAKEMPGDELRWLWRSQIRNYHKHDWIFEHWIGRMLQAASRWNQSIHAAGSNGFDVYRGNFSTGDVRRVYQEALNDYKKIQESIISDLKKLTTSSERSSHESLQFEAHATNSGINRRK
jgi:hypothetical protein